MSVTLFSQQHIDFQKQVHDECPAYGNASLVFAPMVSELCNANVIQSLLDYGAGEGQVPQNLELDHDMDVQLYDPAIKRLQDSPKPAEMVVCLDVLDAVETDCIDAVLDDLKSLTTKMAFFAINTMQPESMQGTEIDDSGREFQPMEWWLPKLMERFELHYLSRISTGFVVVLKAQNRASVQ